MSNFFFFLKLEREVTGEVSLKVQSRGGCTSISVPKTTSIYRIHHVGLSMFMDAYLFSIAEIILCACVCVCVCVQP